MIARRPGDAGAGRARPARPRANCAASAAETARIAVGCLHTELVLYPKPGLVSLVDNGSHTDMTAVTFMRSLFALRHYFARICRAGIDDAPFSVLKQLGIEAEARMLRATGGINTHRGAIFSLGMLCAAIGRGRAQGMTLDRRRPARDPADPLGRRTGRAHPPGRRGVARRAGGADCHAASGAREEGALGLPSVFEVGLPAMRRTLAAGRSMHNARIDALFALMAHVSDTNVFYRGGAEGAAIVRRQAAAIPRRRAAPRIPNGRSTRSHATASWSPKGCRPAAPPTCWPPPAWCTRSTAIVSARLLLLCPGQGGQHGAMFDLARTDAGAAAMLDAAGLSAVDLETMFDNRVAQPAIVGATLAMWEALRRRLPAPSLVAGYSVGELSAYGVAGALDPLDAVRLAATRAGLMDAAIAAPQALGGDQRHFGRARCAAWPRRPASTSRSSRATTRASPAGLRPRWRRLSKQWCRLAAGCSGCRWASHRTRR